MQLKVLNCSIVIVIVERIRDRDRYCTVESAGQLLSAGQLSCCRQPGQLSAAILTVYYANINSIAGFPVSTERVAIQFWGSCQMISLCYTYIL